MAKQIGSQKTGGRQKGTPNRKTQLLSEILEAKDFCILEKLTELLPSLQPEKQAEVLVDLLPYVFPKRKAIEQTVTSVNLNANFNHVEEMTAEQRHKRIEQLNRHWEVISNGKPITPKTR